MKRTPLKRKNWLRRTPLRRGSWLERATDKARQFANSRSPIARIGARGRRLKAKGVWRGPLCDFVRGMICAVPDCYGRSDPCHVKRTGKGFLDWLMGWVGNVANFCRVHHDLLDDVLGEDGFEAEFGMAPAEVARQRGEEFKIERPEEFERIRRAA